MKYIFFAFIFLLIGLIGCKKKLNITEEISNYEPGEEFSAGSLTSYDVSELAFSYQMKGMNQQDKLNFFVGNSFFQDNWVEAPSTTTARDGLGPLFNAKSCAGCHFKDGRGKPESGNGLLFRLSIGQDGNYNSIAELIYGGQFQDKGISSVQSEGSININYEEIPGIYPDGTLYSLRKPTYSLNNLNYGQIDGSVMISPRIGQQIIGMGLLELIKVSDLESLADEYDMDGDGITGRINYVWNPITQATEIGRLGWKANIPSVEVQVAAAFHDDIGITTSYFLNENHSSYQTSCNGLPNGGIPEISDENLEKVILYTKTLAVPIRRNYTNLDVLKGKSLFTDLGCVKCHNPKFTTGNSGNLSALKNVEIRPYTDLLLHYMGEGLADHRPDFQASGYEWRTQPLWGLGLIKTVNNHTFLLHDGRARSIEEAILWHGGEAESIKKKFMNLTAKEREQLIQFLESL